MAFELLRTDYVDAVFEGLRRYIIGDNGDGTVSFIDVTNYTVREGSFFGAKDANAINTAVNAILAALNNGTNLYDVFTMFFETQKALFEKESDTKQEGFEQYITDLRAYMDGKWDELKDEYTGDIQYFKDVQENAFNVWFQMVRDQLTNDVAGHLQTQIGNLQELTTNNSSNLVEAVNEVNESVTANVEKIGELDTLKTKEKSNIVSAINEVKDASGVSGVKGSKETAYRTGKVNLTPENIGALPDSTVPVSKGGTGKTTAAEGFASLANGLSKSNTSVPNPLSDGFLFPLQHGSISTDTYLLTSLRQLWDHYLKRIIEKEANAVTANALKTERYIDGREFDGTEDITHLYKATLNLRTTPTTNIRNYYEYYLVINTGDRLRVGEGTVLYLWSDSDGRLGRYYISLNSVNTDAKPICYGNNDRMISFKGYHLYGFVLKNGYWCPIDPPSYANGLVFKVSGTQDSTASVVYSESYLPHGAYLVVGAAGPSSKCSDYFSAHLFISDYAYGGEGGSKLVALGTAGSTARYSFGVSAGSQHLNVKVNANMSYEIQMKMIARWDN